MNDAVKKTEPAESEQETEAKAQGWNPDYDGKNKKTAEEFIHDGRFFKQIDNLKNENSKLRKSFNELTGHYHRVQESEQRKAQDQYKQEIEKLKAEKLTALDEGDNARVVEIDEQIRTQPQPEQKPEINTDFQAWLQENSWYNESVFLQVEADKVGEFYFQQGHRGAELYEQIGNHVRELHPDKFENKKRSSAATVEGGSTNGAGGDESFSEKSLTPNEKEVFKQFKDSGVFKTKEEEQTYLKQVKELR